MRNGLDQMLNSSEFWWLNLKWLESLSGISFFFFLLIFVTGTHAHIWDTYNWKVQMWHLFGYMNRGACLQTHMNMLNFVKCYRDPEFLPLSTFSLNPNGSRNCEYYQLLKVFCYCKMHHLVLSLFCICSIAWLSDLENCYDGPVARRCLLDGRSCSHHSWFVFTLSWLLLILSLWYISLW